jgi:hypothetical protein
MVRQKRREMAGLGWVLDGVVLVVGGNVGRLFVPCCQMKLIFSLCVKVRYLVVDLASIYLKPEVSKINHGVQPPLLRTLLLPLPKTYQPRNETIEEVEPPLTIAEFSVALNLRVFADRSCSPIDKEKSASAIPNPATQHRRTLQ